MLLSPPELHMFFKLHRTLMLFVNQRLRVLHSDLATPEEFAVLSPETRLKVRDAFVGNPELIKSFVDQNPAHLPDQELDIVLSWQHQVAGNFLIFREMKKYTVFLSMEKPQVAYGVVALSQPFEEIIGSYLPVMTKTALLPFKDKIVYDGLLNTYRISFGAGIRRSLNEGFKEAKERLGIVTSLPVSAKPVAVAAKKPRARARQKATPEEEADDVVKAIVGMTDDFCGDHLNDEYAALCRKLAQKLSRKCPSPVLSGNPNTWACAIVRTIGKINFLHDSSQTPHMKLTDIDKAFGLGGSTGQGKSMMIQKVLKIRPFDHEWTLPSHMDDNPLIWMVTVDGFPMDIRQAPREAQEVAFEKGLIPYIPADR